MASPELKLKKKDFETPQDVRWCPGCGDYSILANVQRFLPSLGRAQHEFAFISGIGCSSRFPYYMNTYGFHTIHGRAPAVATGVKCVQPDLSVWMVTGDGDALSIGGNHLIHALRRNLDINLLLFNNRIYGLTKGQYSPTSEIGKLTKSTPYGSVDQPLSPIRVALGSNASFVSRTLDIDAKHSLKIFEAAEQHRGTSFVEIFQNCNIFNDGAFDEVRERAQREEHMLLVEHGEPLVFGKERTQGIQFTLEGPQIIGCPSNDREAAVAAGVTVYDSSNRMHAESIAALESLPEAPVPLGIFYQEQRPTFDDAVREQVSNLQAGSGDGSTPDDRLSDLFSGAGTWIVS